MSKGEIATEVSESVHIRERVEQRGDCRIIAAKGTFVVKSKSMNSH